MKKNCILFKEIQRWKAFLPYLSLSFKSQKPTAQLAACGQCLLIISVLALMKKNSEG
jgi:hypothetical protein